MEDRTYQSLVDALNALVDSGEMTTEHARWLFAQATADPANPNQRPHPNPGEHVGPSPHSLLLSGLRTSEQVYESGRRAVPWVLEGIIPGAAITLFVSPPKVGKTTLLLSVLESMTTGEPWAGREVEQGPAWVFSDEGDHSLSEIIEDVGPSPNNPHRFFLISQRQQADWSTMCYLITALISDPAADQPPPPRLLIFDTFSRWSELDDGNSYTQSITAFGPLQKLRDATGCAVVLAHHARKDPTGGSIQAAIGSTGFTAQADHVLSISKLGDGNTRKLEAEGRFRGAIDSLTVTYNSETRRFQRGAEFLTPASKEEQRDAAIIALFTPGEEVPMRTLWEAHPAGMGEQNVRGTVRRLIERGVVVTNGLPANSPQLRYSLAPTAGV